MLDLRMGLEGMCEMFSFPLGLMWCTCLIHVHHSELTTCSDGTACVTIFGSCNIHGTFMVRGKLK